MSNEKKTRYFIDAEFHEFKKPVKFLGITIKEVWTIELISIGIVSQEGKEYYAIHNGFDVKKAFRNEWLNKNIFLPFFRNMSVFHKTHNEFDLRWAKRYIKQSGKSLDEIKFEIIEFLGGLIDDDGGSASWYFKDKPEFWGYFASYDWIVFCWIFGQMIALPNGFPMYIKDLKQTMDSTNLSKEWKREKCPDPEGAHNALVDAKWNKLLYDKIFEELQFRHFKKTREAL